MPQMVAALMLLAIRAFRSWSERRSARIVSVVCYLAAALTYEDVFPLFVLFPLLAQLRGERGARLLRASMPFASVAVGLAALAIAMRAIVHLPSDSPYAANFAAPAFLRTAWYQISAALPLSYWIFDPQRIFDRSNLYSFYRNAPISPFVVLAFLFAGYIFVRDALRASAASAPLAAVGAALLVLPALPIAATLKYQHELRLGLGYLPVLFQLFGTALLCVALVQRIGRGGATRTKIAALACAVALVAAMAQATNVRVALAYVGARDARTALERELGNGLAATVPDGAFIAVAPRFDWIDYDDSGPDGISARGMFYQYGRARVSLVAPGDPRATYTLDYDEHGNRWSLRRRTRV